MKLEDLVDPAKYQIFLLRCPCNLPVSFARHHWFVVNKKGALSRWELLFRKDVHGQSWDYLHKDAFSPFSGIEVLPYQEKWCWKAHLLETIEGGDDSDVANAISLIED